MKRADMKRVYSNPNAMLVQHMRNLLDSAGIACELRNEFLMGGAGDLPVLDCWPEIWVEAALAARAERVIQGQPLPGDPPAVDWICAGCGTLCEAPFDRCWQCGALRPS